MRLPAPLLRRNPNVHKNDFGHVFVLAGSPSMVGAAVLTTLAAMRTGAGLVTLGVPKGLNLTAQRKISPVIMTYPLPETKGGSVSYQAFKGINKRIDRFNVLVLGPGLSRDPDTQKLILKIVLSVQQPLVIDADALYTIASHPGVLRKTKSPKILTPHLGEMARLTGIRKELIEKNREAMAKRFSRDHRCILVLKGHRTVVASPEGKIYVNKTGNAGMATAGSGDVLTGMIAALLAQGLSGFEAAKWGVYLHGKAGDWVIKKKSKFSLIATDLIEAIAKVMKS